MQCCCNITDSLPCIYITVTHLFYGWSFVPISMLEVHLAEEWWIFQYSNTKDPRHNLYSVTLVCSYQHWLLYCLKYSLALKSTLNGFSPSLNVLFFFRSKASEGSYQLLSGCGLCDRFLWCQEACFIASFLSLFLAVIAKSSTTVNRLLLWCDTPWTPSPTCLRKVLNTLKRYQLLCYVVQPEPFNELKLNLRSYQFWEPGWKLGFLFQKVIYADKILLKN